MWGFARRWLGGAWAYLAAVAGAAGAVVAVWLSGRKAGREEMRRKAAEARADYLRKAAEKQADYAEETPDEKRMRDDLRNGTFIVLLGLLPLLGGCAAAGNGVLSMDDAKLICPRPTPISAETQRKALNELNRCGESCNHISKVLAACGADRRKMRACRK